jgi:hypothetical protein
MADCYVQVRHRWIVSQADEVNRSRKVHAGQRFQSGHSQQEVLLMPLGNIGAGLHFRGHDRGFPVLPMDDRIQKPNLNNSDMPCHLSALMHLACGV